MASGLFFVSKLSMPEVFNYKEKKLVFLSTHFYFLYLLAGQRTECNYAVLSFFFVPMDIFCFTSSDFGRLYSSLFLCLLEERSGTVISVLTGISFRTEGSKYLELIFLQLFSPFPNSMEMEKKAIPPFGNCCHFPCMVCTGVLKQEIT